MAVAGVSTEVGRSREGKQGGEHSASLISSDQIIQVCVQLKTTLFQNFISKLLSSWVGSIKNPEESSIHPLTETQGRDTLVYQTWKQHLRKPKLAVQPSVSAPCLPLPSNSCQLISPATYARDQKKLGTSPPLLPPSVVQ